MTQVRTAASPDATRIPAFAACRSVPVKEVSAMSRETVKPMPATEDAPTSAGHGSGSGNAPPNRRVTSQVVALMPTSLPTTSPITISSVIGDVVARAMVSASKGIPALARAKTGTTR
nr:hypothetical protein [Tessaracoccus sp. OS52]